MRQHTMKGVAYRADRTVEVIDYPMPTPGPGQVLIEMKAAAICGSDLHRYRRASALVEGQEPWVPGHEPAGVVEQVGQGVAPEAHRLVDDLAFACLAGGQGRCVKVEGILDLADYLRIRYMNTIPMWWSKSFL